MSGVFQNIAPPLTAPRVCTPPSLVRGEDTRAGRRGVGGSIFWKTPDTAKYSTYVSTLCVGPMQPAQIKKLKGVSGRACIETPEHKMGPSCKAFLRRRNPEYWIGFFSFYIRYSTLFHLPPFRFHCVGGC
jgi:hypothetical protein